MSKRKRRLVIACSRYSKMSECVGHYHGECGSCMYQVLKYGFLKPYVKPFTGIQLCFAFS